MNTCAEKRTCYTLTLDEISQINVPVNHHQTQFKKQDIPSTQSVPTCFLLIHMRNHSCAFYWYRLTLPGFVFDMNRCIVVYIIVVVSWAVCLASLTFCLWESSVLLHIIVEPYFPYSLVFKCGICWWAPGKISV